MLPPAPGRFSTTTGWPQVLRISSAIRRVTMSVLPPAVNPTTIVICLLGYALCAEALATAQAGAIEATIRANRGPVSGESARDDSTFLIRDTTDRACRAWRAAPAIRARRNGVARRADTAARIPPRSPSAAASA